MTDRLLAGIRDVPDFPKPGILFKDITPLLKDPQLFREAVERLAAAFADDGAGAIVGIESRGFLFGASLAYELGIGFVPVRKPGKLPYRTVEASYELEYGADTLQMHEDALGPGDRALLVDDLLATGGTMEACCRLVEGRGAVITGCGFVVELAFLDGRRRLGDRKVVSLLQFA